MNRYSNTSAYRLSTCHDSLQRIFHVVLQRVDHAIIDGHRDEEAQNKAVADGKSTLLWPHGKHNTYPSMAVDAAPYFAEIRGIDWEDVPAICMFAGRVMEIAEQLYEQGEIPYRLRWGGDWDGDGRTTDQRLKDYVHFELIVP